MRTDSPMGTQSEADGQGIVQDALMLGSTDATSGGAPATLEARTLDTT